MKLRTILSLTALLLCHVLSFGQTGDTMSNPIVVGTFSGNISFSDTRNTASFTNQYTGRPTNDVYHKLILTQAMEVTFTHEGSSVNDTYMHILNSSGTLIASNDDYSGTGHCTNTLHSYIKKLLNAGTYYIVSEGYSQNGNIKLNITGVAASEFGYTGFPSSDGIKAGVAGALGSVFDVSPMGAATYSIPISVPQGVGGLQPQLGIVYNSQSGNGLVGYGTNLSGLSAITRGAKDLYHDGTATGMTYLAGDALYLNGVRLILTSGSAGQPGAVYCPESDPFTKVIVHGTYTSTSNNTYYEVQSSDGMVYWYGDGTDSRLSYFVDGKQKIHSWNLSRVVQPTGNFIEYYYANNTDNYLYLSLIAYGTNLNQTNTLSNTISFSYENRNDIIPIRFDGVQGRISKRLKTITVSTAKSGESDTRTYTFNYNTTGDGTATKFSRLTGITEKNSRNETLTTSLAWSYLPAPTNNATAISVNAPANLPSGVTISTDGQSYVSGDMNGDGVDDLISLSPATAPYNGGTRHFTVANIHYSSIVNNTRVFNTSNEYFEVNWLGYFIGRERISKAKGEMITDINGDGINECILPVFMEHPRSTDEMNIHVFGKNFNDRHDFTLDAKGKPLTATADMNNDGKSDLVILETSPYSGTYYKLHVMQLKDNYVPGSHSIFNYSSFNLSFTNQSKQMYATDMNGNGTVDLLILFDNGYTIYWNQGNGTFSESSKTIGSNVSNYLKKNT